MSDYKIVYILIDDENLNFYKELKISVFSLKKYNPEKQIIVMLDQSTLNIINEQDPSGLKDLVEYRIVENLEKYSNVQKTRWIKTHMKPLIEGDFLYIDTDTVVCAPFPEIPEDIDLGFVWDRNVECFRLNSFLYYIDKRFKELNLKYDVNEAYFNGGLMFVKDSKQNEEFFQKWFKSWEECVAKGCNLDQYSLYTVNIEMGKIIKPLDNIWNVQVTAQSFQLDLFNRAVIIHSIGMREDSPFSMGRKSFYKGIDVKDNKKILELLENTKMMIEPGFSVCMDNQEFCDYYRYKYTYAYKLFNKFTKKKKLLNFFEKMIGRMYEFLHQIKKKLKSIK